MKTPPSLVLEEWSVLAKLYPCISNLSNQGTFLKDKQVEFMN